MISIIIPYYNNSNFLNRLFITLVDYLNEDCEIIIIDDCSSNEEYIKLIRKVESYNASNIMVLRNEKNYGASFSRQKGVDKSSGEFIAFLDADDGWIKNRIFLICDHMKNKNIDICGGHPKYINNNFLNHRNGVYSPIFSRKMFFINFLYKNYYTTPSVVMRRSIFLDESFNNDMRYSEDLEFWRRAVHSRNAYLLDDSGAYCFKHPYIPSDPSSLSSRTVKMAKSEIYGLCLLLNNKKIPFFSKLLIPSAISFSFSKFLLRTLHINMVKLLK